jgi:hypothetical protein
MTSRPASIFPLRVTQLWAMGEILGPAQDVDLVVVALCVDLPPADVAWLTEPPGAQHWGNANRLPQNPIRVYWRSAHAPVWNHEIVRPALVWDDVDGVRQPVLDGLRDGAGEHFRTSAPAAHRLRERLADELAISRAELDRRTDGYEQRRWQPGKLDPVADALWRASRGYLDVLDAVAYADRPV